jgi:hypothetical protein
MFMIIDKLSENTHIKIKKLLRRLLMIIENILLKQLMIIKILFKNLINNIMIEMYIRENLIMTNIIMIKIIKFLSMVNLKIHIIQIIISKTNKSKCNPKVKKIGSHNKRPISLIEKLFMRQNPKTILITRILTLMIRKVVKEF